MSRWIRLAINERKVTILLSIIILFYGMYTYYYLPRQENPDTSSPAVQIITMYPGATAETVEEQVSKKVEDEIAALDGVDEIKSYSQDHVSIVIGFMEHNIDYEEQWDKLREGLSQIESDMPEGVSEFDINTELTTTADIILSIGSDSRDYDQLNEYAETFKGYLNKIDGLERIEIQGVQEKEIIVEVENEALYALDVSIDEVYNIIRAQNVAIPSGAIKTENGKINVQVPKGIESLKDIENIIITISPESGAMVRLKDISDIYFDYNDKDAYFEYNQTPSIMLVGYFKGDQNVVLVGDEVRSIIEEVKNLYPEDIMVDEVLFLPEDIDQSINNFIKNLLQGIVLVLLVIFIGMGVRNALIVSVAIPLSLAVTSVTMSWMGIDLQQVSIAALIISLGILVDNAIVISDAIQVHINNGMDNFKASFEGARESSLPVLTSTLTTIAAFSPLMTLPASAGEFVKSLPQVVIIALIASYVVAMLVTPALASLFLVPRNDRKDILHGTRKFYTGVLNNNLKHPIKSSMTVLVIFLCVAWSFMLVEVRMFPYVDKDLLYVNVNNEISGDIENTAELVRKTEEMLLAEPEIENVASAIGGGLPRFYMTADFVLPSENRGQILAPFDLSKGGRFSTRSELFNYLQNKFDMDYVGGNSTVNLLDINMPGPTIEVRVSGDDIEHLKSVTDLIYQYLLDSPETINVQSNKPTYRYEYKINVDDDQAMQMAISKYDLQYQINLALNGSKASVLSKEGNDYNIVVKSDIKNTSDIENLPIKSSYTGNKVLVKQMADISIEEELNIINRYDRQMVITVSSDVRPQFGASSVQQSLEDYIKTLDMTELNTSYGGDQKTTQRYLSGLYLAAIFALIIIYVILLIQFNSMKQPLIILSTIPLAMIGIVLSLLITGTNFTFTVGLGATSLLGIVVNNGILLIEYINRARKNGMSVIEACKDSVGKRMRPILLSSLTTIFGLIPLAFADSSFFSPMAIALLGGLFVATFMTITVVPTIYYILEREKPGGELKTSEVSPQ
jgi:multidrug efflux pump subunit AcrB